MKRKDNLGTIVPKPKPRPLIHSAHYEALLVIRRTDPARYISMRTETKAALEVYELLRARGLRRRLAA